MFVSTTPAEESTLIEQLHQIELALQQYSRKRKDAATEALPPHQIALCLPAYSRSSQQILTALIGSRSTQRILAALLHSQLIRTYSPSALQQLIVRCSVQVPFAPSSLSLPSLIKEIRQHIQLIHDEMVELQGGLREVARREGMADGEEVGEADLWGLLRVVMEESEVDLDEPLSEMLLRLYILEESVSLVLSKTQQVAARLREEGLDYERTQRASSNSEQSHKRSALSESLLIFKERQLQQEKQRSEVQFVHKSTLIRTDYSPQRIRERKVKSSELCCFRF